MTPTVGRIVHYKTRGSADGTFKPTVFASIITEVCDRDCVSLVTFGPNGIRFEGHVNRGYGAGEWNWPEIESQTGATPGPMLGMGGGTVNVPMSLPQQYLLPQKAGTFPGQSPSIYNAGGPNSSGTKPQY